MNFDRTTEKSGGTPAKINGGFTMSKIFKRITAAAMAGVIAMSLAATASAEHFIPGTDTDTDNKVPCNSTYYTLGHHPQVGRSTGTHNYTCTVTYYAYRHSKWCNSCGASLGFGPTYICTEDHTCGNYIRTCTGVFKD